MQKEHFTLSPMQDYSPPAYPNRGENPLATLKKLPVRWAKNAAVLACIGALGLGALTGGAAQGIQPSASYEVGIHGVSAAYLQNSTPSAENERTFDVVIRTHFGGSGAGPFYVAHLTEQEALGIIQNRLSQAGIAFDAPVPDYAATLETPWGTEITARLSLFDEDTRQGIVFPIPWGWQTEWNWWEVPQDHIERTLQQEFAERFDISATFLSNPGESMCNGEWLWNPEARPIFTDEEKQAAGGVLNERLKSQVDSFIAQLRAEGILPPAAFPFADVSAQHWARQAITHVWEQGIMTGTTESTFDPDTRLTRAQAVAILWRMADEPGMTFQPTFEDVPNTAPAWYRHAVLWASETGVAQGFAGRFDPYGAITREQFAAMLHRYAQLTGGDLSIPESFSLDQFADRTELSEWAIDYMRWAVYHGLIAGRTADTLAPLGTATRAEAATILTRFLED